MFKAFFGFITIAVVLALILAFANYKKLGSKPELSPDEKIRICLSTCQYECQHCRFPKLNPR